MKISKYVIPNSSVVYKPSNPFHATLISSELLTEEGSPDEVRNIVFDISTSGIHYIEGQSIGIIPPGNDAQGKPLKPRLYSIASSRTGDDGKSTTITLCVKRVNYPDETTGEIIRGPASNYLCDLKPGERAATIGPNGRRFLLPADDTTDLIMLAVGTGIAPFRAFVNHIYREKGNWNGKVKLFYGAKTGMEALFMNRRNDDIGQYMTETTFNAFRALSQAKTGDEEKGYVQQKVATHQKEIWDILSNGKFSLYICGLKGMEQGIEEVLSKLADQQGKNWIEMKKQFLAEGRWNTEVY